MKRIFLLCTLLFSTPALFAAQEQKNLTNLYAAVEKNNIEEVKTLLSQRVTALFFHNNKTPLQEAALQGNFEMCKLLLEESDDAKDAINMSMQGSSMLPLTIAGEKQNKRLTNLLLQHGANPFTPDESGFLVEGMDEYTKWQMDQAQKNISTVKK